MVYIHFIVNPISGKGSHEITETFLKRHFHESNYKIAVYHTKHPKHAIEITNAIVRYNPDCIVACGGDGTINEVASCLVNTPIKLGIIPVGSGNGLASNLNIPRDIDRAVEIIKHGTQSKIDVGRINDHYFFSNMGIGIDAMIIGKYEQSGKRTLVSYVKAALSASFWFKPVEARLKFEGQTVNMHPFLLFISNSNEMGYGMSLTPNASLSDGFLDLILVPELSFIQKLQLGLAVLRNKTNTFKLANHTLIRSLEAELPDRIFLDAQIDGEYYNLKTNKIKVGMINGGLKVLTP
ncbi:diacylglycerol/lipid kinase family protein [Flavobacterium pallidum]|uniref:Lipid kinase n=1 Tax=Flavobacterium pallidum TaxID=2172098 RepID=A0A2S1SFX3_9FLAO|nr:diacylglycerol kinase family protein [Flavobacterium pallidum]AWI25271.1 lipid kinase [Flavobacterium pallidum]